MDENSPEGEGITLAIAGPHRRRLDLHGKRAAVVAAADSEEKAGAAAEAATTIAAAGCRRPSERRIEMNRLP